MGGASDGGSASVNGSDVIVALPPVDKRLQDLTSTEISQLHQYVESNARQQIGTLSKQQLCHRQAVLSASIIAGAGASGTDEQVKSGCASAERYCIQQDRLPSVDTRDFHPDEEHNSRSFGSCRASVGEYWNCSTDLAGAHLNVILSLPPCDALDTHSFPEGLETLPSELVEPASCATLYSTCSNLERYERD